MREGAKGLAPTEAREFSTARLFREFDVALQPCSVVAARDHRKVARRSVCRGLPKGFSFRRTTSFQGHQLTFRSLPPIEVHSPCIILGGTCLI